MSVRLTNVRLATMSGPGYGLIDDGAVVMDGAQIAFAGTARGAPDADTTVDGEGLLVTPGLVDPHTHLVYAGNRASEWEARLNGIDYAEIARSGGGIAGTVRATRAASDDLLRAAALGRLRTLADNGVTTVEIKSGYGLDTETEVRILQIARELAAPANVSVRTTFLGAHALPAEYAGREDAYVDLVCTEMLTTIAAEGLADAVDAFCETIAFTPAQTERIFAKAAALGLPVKLHADQLSDGGGARLAAKAHALSADHLEFTSQDGVEALAQSGTVAVLLPGAYYFLRETQKPPVAALRAARVPIALATDCNPGTSPIVSPLVVLNLACTLFGLTPLEALHGLTTNAARALGLSDRIGSIETGKIADLALWDVAHPVELAYAIGARPCVARYVHGRFVKSSAA
ncbi:MAG: imidazolonepropionase [Candidatus Velthaea sp.]